MISHPPEAPLAPTQALDIRMLVKQGRSARRALTELGINDPEANLKMAEALLAITAQEFMKQWNFDPVRCRPLPAGRYQWSPARAAARKLRLEQKVARAAAGVSHALVDTSDRLGEETRDDAVRLGPAGKPEAETRQEARPLPLSPRWPSNTLVSPRAKQCKITEFGRQRKRLLSCTKSEETGRTKRRLLLSPPHPHTGPQNPAPQLPLEV